MNDHDGTIGYILWWLFDKIVMDIITTWNQEGDVIGHQWKYMVPLGDAFVEV